MEWACSLPFAVTILVVAGVWVVEQVQAVAWRHGQVSQNKAGQAGPSSLRSAPSGPMAAAMTVPPGRA
jgi:hypothetical protein